MSNLKKSWSVLPLLSLLAISPSQMESKARFRQLASVSEQKEIQTQNPNVEKRSHFNKLISKIEKVDLSKSNKEMTLEIFNKNKDALAEKIKKEETVFKKNNDSLEEVKTQRKDLESIVSEIVLLEDDLSLLKSKNLLPIEDESKVVESIEKFKDSAESLLTELEVNENLVAKNEKKEEVKEEKKEVVVEKKEEVKKEEEIKEEVVKKDDSQNEAKEEVKKEEVCKKHEKEVLTQPVQQLAQDQSLIMQQMMSMTQMMMMMFQQYQIFEMQQRFQNQGPVNQQAYQYAPQQAGNWVYYPNGFKPGGMYPDQFGQMPQSQAPTYQQPQSSYNNWGMPSQNYFESDPRMNPMTLNPGQFGQPALGFNMSANPSIQAPMYQPPMPSQQTYF